jgi:hypothetical protein
VLVANDLSLTEAARWRGAIPSCDDPAKRRPGPAIAHPALFDRGDGTLGTGLIAFRRGRQWRQRLVGKAGRLAG